jgi:hypothetical protein
MKFHCLFLVAILCFSFSVNAQQTGSITGVVLDKNTQLPVADASVQLQNTQLGTSSDALGKFRLQGIPVKTYNVIISRVGYKSFTIFNSIINSGNENTYTIELEAETGALTEVVVKSNKKTVRAATLETPLSVQRLTAEEIKSNPGGNFDISKVIQTLPGVGGGPQGGTFRNDIIIRGGAPNENVF